jgi:hypothetical protein
MKKEVLEKLLKICTQESHFQFNGKYYDQIDGVSMGSPLGPLFANIFMDDFEGKHITKLKELGVQTWMRYVDDVFATIKRDSNKENILKFLNEQHSNIKFTIEMEKNNSLPFLDTLVKRKEAGYTTTIYHKKTFTGVYLNWTSLTSRRYKIKLIYCLCDRIWKICKQQEDKELEFKKLRQTLIKNQYPEHIIDKEIEKFVSNRAKLTNNEQTNNNNNNNAQKEDGKMTKYFALPFVSNKAEEFSKRLTKLVSDTFPQIDLKIAFTTPNQIGKLFPFKDNIKDTKAHSYVVYSIKCITCGQEYIGKTQRILTHRIKEHNDPKKDSAIQMHLKEFPSHEINAQNVKILDSATNNKKLMVKEMLHITSKQPSLNTQHAAKYKNKYNKDKPFDCLNTVIIGRKA